jgi:hypothetical protein
MVVPEVILGQIAVQMPLGAVLVDADHAAGEDAEESFNRVRGDQIIALSAPYSLAPWKTVSCFATWAAMPL